MSWMFVEVGQLVNLPDIEVVHTLTLYWEHKEWRHIFPFCSLLYVTVLPLGGRAQPVRILQLALMQNGVQQTRPKLFMSLSSSALPPEIGTSTHPPPAACSLLPALLHLYRTVSHSTVSCLSRSIGMVTWSHQRPQKGLASRRSLSQYCIHGYKIIPRRTTLY